MEHRRHPRDDRCDPLLDRIAALDADDIGAARAAATDIDQVAAREAFLAAYPKLLSKGVDSACADLMEANERQLLLEKIELTREERIDIEDAIEAALPDKRRRLQVCLLAVTDRRKWPERWKQLVTELEGEKDQVSGWAPDEAGRFGYILIDAYDPLAADRDLVAAARPFLDHALAKLQVDVGVDNKKKNKLRSLFSSVLGVCQKQGPQRWCWDLAGDLAKTHSGLVALDFAWTAQDFERREDILNVFNLLEMAENGITSARFSEDDRAFFLTLITFIRANVTGRLATLDRDENIESIVSQFKEVTSSKYSVAESAQEFLIKLLVENGRFAEAHEELKKARERWPDGVRWSYRQFWLGLAEDDLEAAQDAANQIRSYLDKHFDEWGQFQLALSEFLLPQESWKTATAEFLTTKHIYVNYVAMFLDAFEEGQYSEEARERLKDRFDEIDPSGWERRLELGDQDVWREMLLGYYLEKMLRDQVFGALSDDETFNKSPFANIRLSRNGMLCEAHFYDALRNRAAGSMDKMRAAFEAVLSTGHRPYIEYSVAKFMLGNEDRSSSPQRPEQHTTHGAQP